MDGVATIRTGGSSGKVGPCPNCAGTSYTRERRMDGDTRCMECRYRCKSSLWDDRTKSVEEKLCHTDPGFNVDQPRVDPNCPPPVLEDKRPTMIEMAVSVLCHELRNDDEYYRSWQSSIAVQFQDAYDMDKGLPEISNEAAKRFLDLLIRDVK